VENNMQVPKEIKNRVIMTQQSHYKDIWSSMFIEELFTIAKVMKITLVFVNRWMDKETMVNI
jgi:hypothetical protein